MGGNALKNVATRRVHREEYFLIRNAVLVQLKDDLNWNSGLRVRCQDIQAYRTKQDFGDLDILVETFPGYSVNYTELITNLFDPYEIVHNSNCYSFDYQGLQVDLILTPTEDYDTSYNYYAWNDLGNLAGRIYKKLGFKYGHRGLSYIFRSPENKFNAFAEVIVSKDLKAILEFGDLDYDEFKAGFDTVEQMFHWVSRSKYFHKDIYLLHNRNHVSRTRDKKRKIYNEFLTWCETAEGLPEYPWTEMREQDGYSGKPEFLREALQKFDGFAVLHCNTVFLQEISERARAKFNGEIVGRYTGLKGKQLGAFMHWTIEQSGGKKELWPKLAHYTTEAIEAFIKYRFSEFEMQSFEEVSNEENTTTRL